VSRTVFWPAPNVDSALVAFTRWPEGSGPNQVEGQPGVTREEVFAVVDAAFAQRRKTLRSTLATWADSAGAAEKVLREAGVEPSLRGEAIGIEQYIQIVLAGRKARTINES
jgi:16S rRNA (adenine1518-N6/adenine1519-N6)-dimethyltransferase